MTVHAADHLHELVRKRQTARALDLKHVDFRGLQLDGLRADGVDFADSDLRAAR